MPGKTKTFDKDQGICQEQDKQQDQVICEDQDNMVHYIILLGWKIIIVINEL